MFSFYVIDVLGYSLYRVYSIKYYVIVVCVFVKVIFYFFEKDKNWFLDFFFYIVNEINGIFMISFLYFIFVYLFIYCYYFLRC